jgi:hypothetical protein
VRSDIVSADVDGEEGEELVVDGGERGLLGVEFYLCV